MDSYIQSVRHESSKSSQLKYNKLRMTKLLSRYAAERQRPNSEQHSSTRNVFLIIRTPNEKEKAARKRKSNAYVQSKRSQQMRNGSHRSHIDDSATSRKAFNSIFKDPGVYENPETEQLTKTARPVERKLKTNSKKIQKTSRKTRNLRHVQKPTTSEMEIRTSNEHLMMPSDVYAATKEINDLVMDIKKKFQNMKV